MNTASQRSGFVLAIESAIAGGSIAVTSDGILIEEWIGSGDKPQAELILEQISKILDKVGITTKEIDVVAVSAGPGSFTGIRIGISTALGIASGIGKTCIRVDLMKSLASEYMHEAQGCIYLPMGRERAVTQQFENSDGRISSISKAEIVDRSEIERHLVTTDSSVLHVFHPTLTVHFSGVSTSQEFSANLAASIAEYATSPNVQVSTPIFVSYNSE